MDPEEKKLLEDTFELVQENNKMLHRIRRSQKMASLLRVLYWVIIIGISVGSFYLLQPYVEKVQGFWSASSTGINKLNSLR